jgi:hypothetical protein
MFAAASKFKFRLKRRKLRLKYPKEVKNLQYDHTIHYQPERVSIQTNDSMVTLADFGRPSRPQPEVAETSSSLWVAPRSSQALLHQQVLLLKMLH